MLGPMTTRLVSVLLILVLSGCGDDAGTGDGGGPDTGGADTGGRDGGGADSGGSDGGGTDGGGTDGGGIDGGGSDAAPSDGGMCTDDDREEDDSFAAAMAVMPIYGPTPVMLSGLVACQGDADFIHAYSDCCTEAGVILTWEATMGDLEAELLDETGAPLTPTTMMSAPGRLVLLVDEHGGDFYIRVESTAAARIEYAAEVHAMIFL
jgi:hypothetical protein